MTVWVVFPSAAPVGQARLCVSSWQAQGYKVAIAVEDGRSLCANWVLNQESYPGYATSVNRLAWGVLYGDAECVAVVAAGDDMMPDQKRTADEIAADLAARHGDLYVAQGTGDRWTLGTSEIPQSERVAGSPWMSREWVRRGYLGKGAKWPEYWHCFADNDLMEVATKLGVFHQEPEITHRHEHFMRHGRPVPAYSAHAYARFADDQAIFERRKAAGFPDSGLLP